jgi:flavorubredoxin
MWHSTQTMAEAIADGLIQEKVETKVMCLKNFHRSEVMTEVLDAGAVLVGSPTLNNGLFPTIADFLTYMGGLKPKNKVAAAFGSYGWSGESVKIIHDSLEKLGFNGIDSGLRIHYVPDKDSLESCRAFGKKVADALPS